jgi:hypothetical protein
MLYYISNIHSSVLTDLKHCVIDKKLYPIDNLPANVMGRVKLELTSMLNDRSYYAYESVSEFLKWNPKGLLEVVILLQGEYDDVFEHPLDAETLQYLSMNVKKNADIWKLINRADLSAAYNLTKVANKQQLVYIKRLFPELGAVA